MTVRLAAAVLLVCLASAAVARGFVVVAPATTKSRRLRRLAAETTTMMVKFDGKRWVAESADEGSAGEYSVLRTLVLHGPIPAARRVFQPDDYDQAVLKFMATEKCDRRTAQGNMDAYMRNPQDWLYFRRRSEEGIAPPPDYAALDATKLLLVALWTAILLVGFGNLYIYIANGDIDLVS